MDESRRSRTDGRHPDSNLRLPADIERRLAAWIVTPRMHGIHHSDYRDETNSNWSSLFPFWDRLHGTLRLDVDQHAIEIGVPAYQRATDVTLGKITALPFAGQRDDWTAFDGVRRIGRSAAAGVADPLPSDKAEPWAG